MENRLPAPHSLAAAFLPIAALAAMALSACRPASKASTPPPAPRVTVAAPVARTTPPAG